MIVHDPVNYPVHQVNLVAVEGMLHLSQRQNKEPRMSGVRAPTNGQLALVLQSQQRMIGARAAWAELPSDVCLRRQGLTEQRVSGHIGIPKYPI